MKSEEINKFNKERTKRLVLKEQEEKKINNEFLL